MDSSAYRNILDTARAQTKLIHNAIDKKDGPAIGMLLSVLDSETRQACLRGDALADPNDQPLQYALRKKASSEIIHQLLPRLDDIDRVLAPGTGYMITYANGPSL